jgi:trigger factor
LSTQIEHLENHTARLTVEVTPERVDKAMHEAARRISRQVNIPGFRKGKAPYNIVLQRVGKEYVLGEALETLGNEVFREALDETKLEPYAPGELQNVETEPTMKLTFVVPKQPEVDLQNYRDIRIPFEEPQVEDEAVNRAMKALQDRRALVEPAARPAQMGDLVKAQIRGERVHPVDELPEAEREHAEGHTDEFINEEITVLLTEDENEEDVIPGFSSNLVGLSAGEKKTFSLSFPEGYEDEALARHTFNFDVEMREVQSRTLPALNDEFAKQVTDNEIDNLLDLRIRIRKDLQDAAKREAEARYAEEVLDKVVEQATTKYPEDMIDEYIDDIVNSMDRNLRERGLSLADYKQIENKSDEDLRAEFRDTAVQRLRRALVLGKIVGEEQLDVSDADVETQIDRMSLQFGEQAQTFRRMLSRAENKRNIAADLVTNRAFRRLIEIARGENPPIGVTKTVAEEQAAPVASTSDTVAEGVQPTEPSAEMPADAAPEVPNTLEAPADTAAHAAPESGASEAPKAE